MRFVERSIRWQYPPLSPPLYLALAPAKAGGTAICGFLERLARHSNRDFIRVEGQTFNGSWVGYTLHTPSGVVLRGDRAHNLARNHIRPSSGRPRRSLLVTHIRDPVPRAWCAHRFEGEWPQVLGRAPKINTRFPNMNMSPICGQAMCGSKRESVHRTVGGRVGPTEPTQSLI